MGIEQDAKVVVKGDSTGAQSAFKQLGNSAGQAASVLNEFHTKHLTSMKAGFQGVTGVLDTVVGKFTALAAVVMGGGAVLKASIGEAVQFTKEVNGLAKVLGISATEATAWNVALGDLYQDSAALIGAVGKLNRVIAEDEEKLTELGIATRDANGHFRTQGAIFQDVTKYLSGFKVGIDRNIEGTRIFGKSWGEVAPLMKLTAERIEEARQKADDLGLTVSKESTERVAAYRGAINDVGDVMLALKNVIGQAAMPVFTRLSEWFSAIGPGAVVVFKGALNGLSTFMQGLVNGISIAWQLLSTTIYTVLAPLIGVAKAVFHALHGDMKAATQAMMDWPSDVGDAWGRAFDSIADSSRRTRDDIANLWGSPTAIAPDVDGADADKRSGKSKGKAAPSRVAEWANVLESQKQVYAQAMLAQNNFSEWGHKEESRYWAGILDRQDISKDERIAVTSKYYAAERALRKEAYGAELAEFAVRLEMARDDYAERDRIAAQAVDFAKEHYGADSKEYQDAVKRRLQIAREHQEKLREIEKLHLESQRADAEQATTELEAQAQLEVDLGIRTRESLLEIKRKGVLDRLQLELDALATEQAAYKQGTLEYEQYEARKAAAKRKAKGLEGDIDRDKTKLDAEPLSNVMKTGESAFSSSIDAIIAKGRYAGAELGKIWRQAGLQMINELVTKQITAWAAGWVKKLALNAAGLATKNGQEVASATTTVATEQATGLASIGVSAARAAAGAYAAIAGIPVVGPVLAPIAAGVALAAVIALGKSMFSAEGGMDIPGGMNPIVQTHAKEMVLPAKYADVIRSMAEGQGRGGGGGDVHLHGTQLPGDFWVFQRAGLVKAFKAAKRNFEI